MSKRRLVELDYERGEGIVLRVRPPLLRRIPPPALTHWRNANKEFLLALRSFLDTAIERVERPGESELPEDGRRHRRVPVTEETPPTGRRSRKATTA